MDLENAANLEEAHGLEECTADEMAVNGYYVVAGIARHEYKRALQTDMGYVRQLGSPCPPLYSQMGVPSPSFVPTSLRTTRDSY